ncbi:MAG TPA: MFS transporter [Enteractinococcus helveticum]|uniref:MFS transporter n=1 Tax=Enteractinococcus helveticum TaxID=1837282 RepID=A0A921FNL9_9MICC|nr:MFS transporter [Enteractinococcus helveticum]HJF14984.1 MFS transporter [Enteractinococcus helveticum]
MSDQSRSAKPLANAFQIYAPSLIYAIGLGAIMPAIAGASTGFGVSLAVAASTVTLIGIGSLIANAPAAQLASRAGERLTMIVSAGVGTLGATLAWAMVAGWFPLGVPYDFAGYTVGILLIGMAGAGFNLARQSYLAVAVPVSHRARAMSLLGGMIRIGSFVGPFLGAGAQAFLGMQGAFAVGAACMGTAVIISLLIQELAEPTTPTHLESTTTSPLEIITNPTMTSLAKEHWRVLLSSGLGVLCLSAMRASRTAVIPLWAEHLGLSPAQASLIYGVSGAIDLIMFYPSGLLMDRKGRRVVAVCCLTGLAIGTASVPLMGTSGWLMVAAVLIGLGNGFGAGIVMTLGADYSPTVGRPKFLALWRLLSDTGTLTGPLLISVVTAISTLAFGVWAIAALGLVGAGIFSRTLPPGPGPVTRDAGLHPPTTRN